MFFVPAIIGLQRSGHDLFVLCLSTGNAEGLGPVRQQELTRACGILGVPVDHVECLDHSELQDGRQTCWPAETVQEFIAQAAFKLHPDLVLTFDAGGVSGHPNHRACHQGARRWLTQHPKSKLMCLDTVGLLRKFVGPLDTVSAICQHFLNSSQSTFCSWQPWLVWQAMAAHHSQFVWYRRLFIVFSRYTFVNTLSTYLPEA